jgi:predicted amidophosphoribosyltransferase
MTIAYVDTGSAVRVKHLNEKGQCCGCKAHHYIRKGLYYCHTCHAEFNENGTRVSNSWWRVDGDAMYPRSYAPMN